MTQSLYPPFDNTILSIVRLYMPDGFDTTPDAERVDSLEKITKIHHKTGRVCVWSGQSANTIFATPEINHAFRAWHDLVHIQESLPFTLQGEIEVCMVQKRHVSHYCKACHVQPIQRLLEIEVIEQVKHYLKTGKHVKDYLPLTCCYPGINRTRFRIPH